MRAQIPWLRVFVEGVVIVGSILLAFGIQAWWKGRQEADAEADYLQHVSSDLDANVRIFQRQLLDWEASARAAEALRPRCSCRRVGTQWVVNWRKTSPSLTSGGLAVRSGRLSRTHSAARPVEVSVPVLSSHTVIVVRASPSRTA